MNESEYLDEEFQESDKTYHDFCRRLEEKYSHLIETEGKEHYVTGTALYQKTNSSFSLDLEMEPQEKDSGTGSVSDVSKRRVRHFRKPQYIKHVNPQDAANWINITVDDCVNKFDPNLFEVNVEERATKFNPKRHMDAYRLQGGR